MLLTNGEAYFSKKYAMHIVDRVGGGDSFGGGVDLFAFERLRRAESNRIRCRGELLKTFDRGRLQYGFGFRSGSPFKRQRLRQSSKIRLKKLKTNEISPVIKKTR